MTFTTEQKATATILASLEGTAIAVMEGKDKGKDIAFTALAMFANGVRITLADPKVGKELSEAAETLVRGEPFAEDEPLIAALITKYHEFDGE